MLMWKLGGMGFNFPPICKTFIFSCHQDGLRRVFQGCTYAVAHTLIQLQTYTHNFVDLFRQHKLCHPILTNQQRKKPLWTLEKKSFAVYFLELDCWTKIERLPKNTPIPCRNSFSSRLFVFSFICTVFQIDWSSMISQSSFILSFPFNSKEFPKLFVVFFVCRPILSQSQICLKRTQLLYLHTLLLLLNCIIIWCYAWWD